MTWQFAPGSFLILTEFLNVQPDRYERSKLSENSKTSAIVVSSRAFLCTLVHGVSAGFLVGDNNSRLLIQFRQRTKLPVEALPANDPKQVHASLFSSHSFRQFESLQGRQPPHRGAGSRTPTTTRSLNRDGLAKASRPGPLSSTSGIRVARRARQGPRSRIAKGAGLVDDGPSE